VGCAILSCEWIVRGNLLLWIHIPSSGVTCCQHLEQQVYSLVEFSSQAIGCTSFKKINVHLFMGYFMILIVLLNFVEVNYLFVVVNDFISCIHVHLECCRCISFWVSEPG
jgi:hypothetical protein